MFDQNLNTCNKSCEIKAKHFYVNIAQSIALFTIIQCILKKELSNFTPNDT